MELNYTTTQSTDWAQKNYKWPLRELKFVLIETIKTTILEHTFLWLFIFLK